MPTVYAAFKTNHFVEEMYMSIARLLNTGIQDLALELVQEIVSYSASSMKYGFQTRSKSKLAELRLVCRFFRLAADPLFFSEINFDYDQTSSCFNTTQDYLQTLIKGTNYFCRYAKTLRINYIPRIIKRRSKAVNNSLAKSSHPEVQGCSAYSLMEAVVTLRNIRIVHWDLRIDQAMDIIIEGLVKFSQLEELYLDFAGYRAAAEKAPRVIIPFRRFKNLRCIDIGGHNISDQYPAYVSGCTRQIHELVKDGAGLSSMALTMPRACLDHNPMQHVLHEIYDGVAHHAIPTLHRLRLSGYSLQLDAVTLPHLRSLVSLDISRANILQEGGDDWPFWHALQTASLRIKELAIQEVTAPLLQYLESYSGLESLISGKDGVARTRSTPEEIAVDEAQRLSLELWSVALPRHKASLVSYMGYNRTESHAPSYMTSSGILALSECKNLRSLVFAVHVSQEYKCSNLKLLVEKALAFPRIQFIQIANTDRFRPRGGCGPAARCLKEYINRIENLCEREILSSAVKMDSFRRGTIDGYCELRMNRKDYLPFLRTDGLVSLRRALK